MSLYPLTGSGSGFAKALTSRAWSFALAGSFALSPGLASAQSPSVPDAATVSQIGKPILPTGHALNIMPHARSQVDFDAWTEKMKSMPARPPQPNLPPRPTFGDDAYKAAKTAADSRRSAELKAPPPRGGIQPLVAPTTIITNKPGPNETMTGNGYYPPDTTGAIGTTQVVFPVNQTLNVYNRGGKLLKSTPFGSFFGTSDGLSDPRVQFDPLWKRWVVTDTRIPQSGDTVGACFYVAVSQTTSATGAWNIYRPCISGGIFAAGDLWDYDMLGLSQDAILVTGNIFGASFKGAAVIAMPKALLYNGQGFSAPVFTLPTTVGTLTPPVIQDTNANAFFLANDSSGNVLDLYRGVNLSNEYQFSFVLQSQPATTYTSPPSALQPGTSQALDTLDGRFQQVTTQYGNTLWAVHTEALGTFPAPRYFQLDTNANTIVQSGFFYESGSSDDFNPSIVANTAGSVFVTWSSTDALSTSGGQHNAFVRFSGRQAGDTANVIGAGSVLATSSVALTGNQQGNIERWGDYSAVTLDPTTSTCGGGQRAAVFNETILNASTWGSQYGLIGFCP